MPKIKANTDPYAPPPMYHDRSGGVVRIALLGGLLGAAALGYVWMINQETGPLVPEVAQEQQVADAGYAVTENPMSETTADSLPAAPAATPAPQRRSAPAQRAPAPAPEPEANAPPPPATATPLPPIDLPPAGAAG